MYGVYPAIVVAERTVGSARLLNVGAATAESTALRNTKVVDERMNMATTIGGNSDSDWTRG